ncbi:MAG: glutamine--fructose-6-phosphate transaminase (isomerizing), partial [Planctomycetota bacterium]
MCGIVGFTGESGAVEAVLEGLARLEYRGYDSAGVAAVCGDRLRVVRCPGKVATLKDKVAGEGLAANSAIGHTRWATHGAPTEANAHPHTDCTGEIALVHNGIIENYTDLRSELTSRGHELRSETDTEVIAHLIEENLGKDGDGMLAAMRAATAAIEGTYAFAVVAPSAPCAIYA